MGSYVVNGKVGNTNGMNLVLGQLSHGLPGVNNGDGVVKGNVLFVVGIKGEKLRAGLEGDGPVNEVELLQSAKCARPNT